VRPRSPLLPVLGLTLAALLLFALTHAASSASAQAVAPAGTARDAPVTLARAEVRALQRRIGQRVDGVLGPRTRAALRRAERRRGLPVDGRPDPVLLDALGLPDGVGRTVSASADSSSPAADPVAAALAVLGAPYRAGGASPERGFDCSGLTAFAFARAGIALPRSSFAQYERGRAVATDAIRRGDLVFFDTAGEGPSDVGIATSPTTVVSATTRGVREHAVFGPYWGEHLLGVRRLLP